jgi:lipoate-protein ligase B
MKVTDIGTVNYGDAWALQERIHSEVVQGGEEQILLVEHPPVITLGRRAGLERHLLATDAQLAALAVEVVQSDRGGDITFHGPGQLVVYPIIRLNDHKLSVGGFVRMLQEAVIAALGTLGVPAHRDDSAVGVWVDRPAGPEKICAIGVRIRRGVSMHGLALNVNTDLRYFDLIVPCGLCNRGVTSIASILGPNAPEMAVVKQQVVQAFSEKLTSRVDPFT